LNNLDLSNNQLTELPKHFGSIKVGGDINLVNNKINLQTFPPIPGKWLFGELYTENPNNVPNNVPE